MGPDAANLSLSNGTGAAARLRRALARLHPVVMFLWDDLKYFLAYARTGSMLAAAKALGVNQSTVQRRLAELEDRLGCRLVMRKRCSATLRRTAGSGWPLVRPEPRHQFIDAVLRPAIHQACDEIGEIDLRIDAIQLTGLDQRRQACPILSAFVAAGKETILSR